MDDSTLVVLARTLRLIITIQDLASTNKSLRADWQERRITTLTLVRDLIAERSGTFNDIVKSPDSLLIIPRCHQSIYTTI